MKPRKYQIPSDLLSFSEEEGFSPVGPARLEAVRAHEPRAEVGQNIRPEVKAMFDMINKESPTESPMLM